MLTLSVDYERLHNLKMRARCISIVSYKRLCTVAFGIRVKTIF